MSRRQLAAKNVTLSCGDHDIKVESLPLPYERAEDSLPDVMRVVAAVMEELFRASSKIDPEELQAAFASDDPGNLLKLAPLLGSTLNTLGATLGGGELKRLAPLILFSTTVTMPDEAGTKVVKELGKVADRRDVFDEYPEHYFPILFFAGRVTYARFFPGKDLLASASKKVRLKTA